MAQNSCLARIDHDKVGMFLDVLAAAGRPSLATVAELNVGQLGRLAPDLLICDVDALEVDPLETLRQLRFVLPGCIIVVYTRDVEFAWGMACHLAGANGLLSKASSEAELELGMRGVLQSGCFTDSHFVGV